jgi:membrane associated rhomboid family serine protease
MSFGQRMYAPPMSRTNRIILISLAVSFVLYSFLSHVMKFPVEVYFGLNYEMFKEGWIFQLVTYPFITRGIFEMLFNGLLIWFLGYDLEYRWGTKRYLMLYLVATLSSGIFFILFNGLLYSGSVVATFPMVGLAGVCSALLVAYAFIYPNREFAFMLIFPIKAKYFVGLLVLMELYFSTLGANKATAVAHLFTIGVTLLYLIFVVKEKNNLWRFKVQKTQRPKVKNRPSHLSLVQEEEEKPKYWH